MPEVLNPVLYRKLEHCFGSIKISNHGEAFLARAVRGIENEPRMAISHYGESYRCCCPFCNDTRFRLWTCHMFGQKNVFNYRMTFLTICFNEGCLSRPVNKQRFIERLGDNIEFARIIKGREVSEEAREIIWPGPCKRLDTLRDDHYAKIYLASRGFDPDFLGQKYQISYCTESDYFLARSRIIIPIFDYGKLKGWQARYVGELPWKDPLYKKDLPAKYFSTPNSQFRSQCIYNWDSMKEWETGVLVEGPTDVWRGGSMFGCIFGNTITEIQFSKILSIFRSRKLILCLDPEEFDSRTTQRRIRQFKARMSDKTFCAIKLPEGTDPGSLDRSILKEYIREQADEQGVKVTYKKVA